MWSRSSLLLSLSPLLSRRRSLVPPHQTPLSGMMLEVKASSQWTINDPTATDFSEIGGLHRQALNLFPAAARDYFYHPPVSVGVPAAVSCFHTHPGLRTANRKDKHASCQSSVPPPSLSVSHAQAPPGTFRFVAAALASCLRFATSPSPEDKRYRDSLSPPCATLVVDNVSPDVSAETITSIFAKVREILSSSPPLGRCLFSCKICS